MKWLLSTMVLLALAASASAFHKFNCGDGSIKDCQTSFYYRDQATDYNDVQCYNAGIAANGCCATLRAGGNGGDDDGGGSNKLNKYYNCTGSLTAGASLRGPNCGWDFRLYSDYCASCDVGGQYAAFPGVTGQLTCKNYIHSPCLFQPDLWSIVTCLNNTLTGMLTNVALGFADLLTVVNTPNGPVTVPLPDPVFAGLQCNPAVDRYARRADGTCNNFLVPWSGAAGGKVLRHNYVANPNNELLFKLNPVNPRQLSTQFLRRTTFKPTNVGINMLAASWVNFFVHDFFAYNNEWRDVLNVAVPADDPDYPQNTLSSTNNYIGVPRQRPRLDPGDSPNRREFRNEQTAWFDLSQIYGPSQAVLNTLLDPNDPAKLRVTPGGLLSDLPRNGRSDPREILPGAGALFAAGDLFDRANTHVGVTFFTTLFALEHNNIVNQLRTHYPNNSAQWYFDRARLITNAEFVKIHVSEWTNQMADLPPIWVLQNAFWLQFGQPFGPTDPRHIATHGVPHDFVTTYRWHSLINENLRVTDPDTGAQTGSQNLFTTFFNTTFHRQQGNTGVLATLAFTPAGELTTNNMSPYFQNLRHPQVTATVAPLQPDSGSCQTVPGFDIGTFDIVREREKASGGYLQMRRNLNTPTNPVIAIPQRFADITSNPDLALQLAIAYNWDLNAVDFNVGAMAEDKLPGESFCFSILASFMPFVVNRVKLDRFYNDDFTADVYTQWGLDRLRGPLPVFGAYASNPNNLLTPPPGVNLAQIILETLGYDVSPHLTQGKVFKVWH